MEIKDLQEQHKNIRREMRRKIADDTIRLKKLADQLAESATNIQGQGYMEFVRSREVFLSEIDKLSEGCWIFACPEEATRI